MNYRSIASAAFLSQVLRVIAGPLTIVFVARSLSSEEMSFYYSFFNVIALQQILEMGVGFVIKQYISHDYKTDTSNVWLRESIESIKSFFVFSFFWFSLVAIFVFIVVGFFGIWFFSSYEGHVIWQRPWWAMVIITSITTLATPIQFLLEGCQQQLILYKGRVFSALVSAISLCISLYYDAGLYSVAISLVFSNVAFYLFIYKPSARLLCKVLSVSASKTVRDTLIEIWPMLSKLSVTWLMGYLFWNSFNLIAFKFIPIELAGRFGFTLSLARAGLSIAESLVASQTTIYASYISSGNAILARVKFERLMMLSCAVLVAGYFIYSLLGIFFPGAFIFTKALSIRETAWIFIYFVLLLPLLLQANFCRCFKKEPYFYLSMFVNIQVPIVFLGICYFIKQPSFEYLLPFSVLALLWSNHIYKSVTK
jgi:O-antigen/teichoic acid export membrane protein